ncbi:hypothetical protein ACFY1B_22550 [Streptomyces mirabilis]|uniref:hypothetical protein n=1 Tax=Streptomyces mirabilis TaxID=68239 RepID=UPI0036822197
MATYLLVRAVARRDGRIWVAYTAVLVAAGLLHEFAVLAITAHAVAVPRGARRAWAGAAAVVLVTVAPLAVLSTRQSVQVSWIGRPGAGALAGFSGTAVLALAIAYSGASGCPSSRSGSSSCCSCWSRWSHPCMWTAMSSTARAAPPC